MIVLESGAESESEPGGVPADLLEAVDVGKQPFGLVAYWAPHVSIELVKARLGEQALAVQNILWRDLRFSLSASHDAYAAYGHNLDPSEFDSKGTLYFALGYPF